MLEAAYHKDVPSVVGKFAHWSYKSDVPLLPMAKGKVLGVIPSETGARQGCGAGNLLFNLSNQAAYECALEGLQNVRGVAITDDFVIAGDSKEAFEAHARFIHRCKQDGHMTVPEKGFVLWPYRDEECPEWIRHLADYFGLQFYTGHKKVWGTYIGDPEDWEAMATLARKRLKKYDPFFERLMHPKLSRHHAGVLLRTCARLTPTYWARTIAPDALMPVLKEYDEKVLEVATSKLLNAAPETDIGKEALFKLTTPIPLGGLGPRPMELVAYPAYLASWMEVLPTLCEIGFDGDIEANAMYAGLHNSHVKTSQALPEDESKEWLHEDIQQLIDATREEPLHKLQRDLVKKIEGKLVREYSVSVADDSEQKARTLSATGPHASTWLTTIPRTKRTFLTDEEYTMALRLRLGMPPNDNMPERCACGFEMEDDANHFLNCPKTRGSLVTKQHHRLVRTRAHFLHKAGFLVNLELTQKGRHGKKFRPDIVAWNGQHSHMSDTTRVNATAPSRQAAGQTTQKVARQAEERKERSYDAKRLSESYECYGPLIPIAYELHGTWGPGAIKALRLIGEAAKEFMPKSAAARLQAQYKACIAVELQRGNATLQRLGIDRARSSRYNLLYEYFPRLPG